MRFVGYAMVTLTFLTVTLLNDSKAHAQRELPYNNNIMGTLSDPRVIKDLELMDDQLEHIRRLQKEFGESRKTLGKEYGQLFKNAPKEEHQALRDEYMEESEKARLKIVAEIKSKLLPVQNIRLEQLTAQRKLREEGQNSAGLLSRSMIDYLDIREDQQNRIRETSEEVRIRVTKEIQAILEEAKQEILDELTPQQKRMYEDLVGDPLPGGESKDKDSKKKSGKEKKFQKVKGFD